ncbi:hypothetical protein SY83_16090 [Paenibacillus swuensis]|uniref:Flagellar protein n=1 Tax=Paenibacillus swuensis TaxID=1178515 RepID=A0A172TQC5_9BACL|nr:hypothetical protein SY83_16090 [Paenibacillus swuensis]
MLNEPPSTLGTTDGSLFGNLFRVMFVLILIIGLIVLLIKFLGQKNRGWMLNRSVKTLGGVALGQNKSVQLVEIGSAIYVVGVGDDIRLLEKIDDPEEMELILSSFNTPSTMNGSAIAHSLSDMVNKWRNRNKPQPEEELEATFQEVFYNKMQQMTSRKKMMEDLMQDPKNNDRSSDS